MEKTHAKLLVQSRSAGISFRMSLTSRIAYNTLVQVLGKAASVLLGLLGIAVVTRYLGQSGFGEFYTAVTFVGFFGVLADLGLYMISIKKLSEAHGDISKLFSNIFTLRLVSALLFVALPPVVVLFFPYPPIVKLSVAVVAGMNLFLSLSQLLTGLYQKELAMSRVTVSETVGKAVVLALVVWFAYKQLSLPWIASAYVIGAAAHFCLAYLFAVKFVRIRLRIDLPVWREVLHESWPVALTVALNLIYFRADTIILTLFKPAAVVGLYGASYKVLEVLIAFPAMFNGLIMPIVTRHYSAAQHEQFQQTLQKAFNFLAIVALPMVAGTVVVAHPLMRLAAGPAFTESGSVLRILIFAAGSIFFGVLFGNTVVAIGRQRAMIPIYATVAVVSVAGYLLLIPPFGMWGAAAMTLATEIAITFGSFFIVYKATKIRIALHETSRVFAASAIMAAVIWPFRHAPIVLPVLAGAVVYTGLLFLFGTLNRATVRELLRTA